MKLLIFVNLLLCFNCFAGDLQKINLGELSSTVYYIDINDASNDEIVINFTLKYKTRECVNRQYTISDGHIASLGCPFYLYTEHTNPEDLVINLENSSAVSKLQNQKIKIEIFPTEKYGPDYDVKVSIVSGSMDQIKKGKTWKLNHKFTLIAKKKSVAVVDTEEILKENASSQNFSNNNNKAVVIN